MTPEALEKLWVKSNGRVPHLTAEEYPRLMGLARHFQRPGARFWGIVDEWKRFREHDVVHCFNFGNVSVKYPWHAEAVNFGQRLPIQITQAGTVRLQKTFRTLLHQVDTPFLVFGYEASNLIEERLQRGFVLTEPDSGRMVTERQIVVPTDWGVPQKEAVCFYFLLKRMRVLVEPIGSMTVSGENGVVRLERIRLRFDEPMVLDPGWAMLLLEGNHWSWGVVAE